MKKPKTVKYFINSFLSESTVGNVMEVSKTVFEKQYNQVIDQYMKQENSDEFYVDKDIYVLDCGTYTKVTTSFSYGICSIDFVKLVCKEGYHFRK